MYDIIIRGGHLVDPTNGVDRIADVAIGGGRVVAVGPAVPGVSRLVLDADGAYVFPGLVDLHVHLTGAHGRAGAAMLARAGVTTALDLGGPVDAVLAAVRSSGIGIQLAALEVLRPGHQLPVRPTSREIRAAVDQVMRAGGFGVKLHVDVAWDPEICREIIAECHASGAWVAIHSGTTTAGSNIEGMAQTVELAGRFPVHIAHVNSYCRGEVADPVREAGLAVELLRSAPWHFAESYLATVNGNTAECVDGLPRPRVAEWLSWGGYPGTRDGLREAIGDGWASIPVPRDDDIVLVTGAEGVLHWEQAGTRTRLCLPINPASSRVLLASSRTDDGCFDIPALATDGGAFPRNVTIRSGLALVELGGLSLRAMVEKACRNPALALGLPDKGHLGAGADADLAIVDRRTHDVLTTISGGEVIMQRGDVTRTGGRFLTTEAGMDAVHAAGLRTGLIPPGQSWLARNATALPEPA